MILLLRLSAVCHSFIAMHDTRIESQHVVEEEVMLEEDLQREEEEKLPEVVVPVKTMGRSMSPRQPEPARSVILEQDPVVTEQTGPGNTVSLKFRSLFRPKNNTFRLGGK